MLQVIPILRDRIDLALVDVESNDRKTAAVEGVGERQPDVPESDDSDAGGVGLDLVGQFGRDAGGGGWHGSSFRWADP